MPAQPFGWFKEPIAGVADIQGFKYRTVGLAADLMQEMGMSVAQLPGGEIVPAMERGVIDAYEFNNPSSDLRFGSADVAKNYYLGSYHQASEAFEFLFNRDFFDDLEPDLQAILKHGVDAASSANTYFALKNYSADLQKLQNELRGGHPQDPGRDPGAAARGLGHADRHASSRTSLMKRIIESQRAWVERVTYYEIMNSPDYTLAYEHYYPGKLAL